MNDRGRKPMMRVRHWPWFVLPGALLGCASPVAPPAPPGGGTALHLDYAAFAATIEPILVNHGCDATGDCHGGGIRGTLQLSPPTAKNTQYDFDQVALQVMSADPDHSPILTKPLALAAGGSAHSVKPFADTTDTEWRSMRAWVRAGVRP